MLCFRLGRHIESKYLLGSNAIEIELQHHPQYPHHPQGLRSLCSYS